MRSAKLSSSASCSGSLPNRISRLTTLDQPESPSLRTSQRNRLFVVHDLASCLLWRAFYDFHWNKQMTPAAALRAAQIWLRDLTSDELKQIADSWQAKEPVAAEEARFFALTERPFSHPLLWSGFVYVGA
jgi:CHAT domain-containing protein